MAKHKAATYSDQEIIKGIIQGGPLREGWITRLYSKYLPMIHGGRKKYKLSEEELKDAYADTIIAISEQIARGDFEGRSKLSTYLYRIFFNKCVDIIRKNATNRSETGYELSHVKSHEQNALHALVEKDEVEHLLGYFEQLGDRCKQILLDWGYWGYNMHEIAERMGFKNNKSVISQKHKCFEKLKELLQKRANK